MPREVHEHFDAGNNLTGYTVVTRESAWDDDSRGRALRLAEYERSICGCGCGQPLRVARDNTRLFRVDSFVCGAGRALAKVQRDEADQAEKTNRPDGWRDGRHYYVEPVEADE